MCSLFLLLSLPLSRRTGTILYKPAESAFQNVCLDRSVIIIKHLISLQRVIVNVSSPSSSFRLSMRDLRGKIARFSDIKKTDHRAKKALEKSLISVPIPEWLFRRQRALSTRSGRREREKKTHACCQLQVCGVTSGGGGGGGERGEKDRGNNDIAGPILPSGMHTVHSTVARTGSNPAAAFFDLPPTDDRRRGEVPALFSRLFQIDYFFS